MGVIFTWFISLPPNSVYTWADLEQKFHDYFFIGETELKLSHLMSVKQKLHECVYEYIRRFTDIINRCYSLTISDRDLADLAFASLLDFHKEKLDGQEFLVLVKFCKRLWLMKAELKKLCKNPMESLIVLFMFLIVNQIVQMMKTIVFMLLNLLGLLIINLALAVLSSRFRKIGKIILSLLLMYPNVIAYLMS